MTPLCKGCREYPRETKSHWCAMCNYEKDSKYKIQRDISEKKLYEEDLINEALEIVREYRRAKRLALI
jgi:hypothetical protein